MAEIIHFAGQDMTFGTIQRQRCLWCGALIDERDFSRMATQIQPGESEEQAVEAMRRTRWSGLVAVDGGARWAVDDPEDGKAPDRSCMVLLPDLDATPFATPEPGERF